MGSQFLMNEITAPVLEFQRNHFFIWKRKFTNSSRNKRI